MQTFKSVATLYSSMRERDWEERRTGGTGSLSQPLSNGEYMRQIEKLQRLAAAGDEDE